MNRSKIIIVGKGASGKDYLKSKFESRGFNQSISCTTRPMRSTEQNGVDYYFTSEEDFNMMIENNLFIEWKEFNGWKYGTPMSEWNEAEIFILTPGGLQEILKRVDRNGLFIIYVDIAEEVRGARLLKRKDADDVVRRLEADNADFKGFSDWDLRITDPNF